jgi:hypothetical protein
MQRFRGIDPNLVLDGDMRPPALAILTRKVAAHRISRSGSQAFDFWGPNSDGEARTEQDGTLERDKHWRGRESQSAKAAVCTSDRR